MLGCGWESGEGRHSSEHCEEKPTGGSGFPKSSAPMVMNPLANPGPGVRHFCPLTRGREGSVRPIHHRGPAVGASSAFSCPGPTRLFPHGVDWGATRKEKFLEADAIGRLLMELDGCIPGDARRWSCVASPRAVRPTC